LAAAVVYQLNISQLQLLLPTSHHHRLLAAASKPASSSSSTDSHCYCGSGGVSSIQFLFIGFFLFQSKLL
jgi:hypothetical protein